MKIVSSVILTIALMIVSCSGSVFAADGGRAIILTGNFQMQVPIDPSASTGDVVNALTQANSALGDLMGKQCAILSETFKRDCRVVQLNAGSNYSDNNNQGRFIRPGSVEAQPVGNANVNVTFQLTPRVEPAKPAADDAK